MEVAYGRTEHLNIDLFCGVLLRRVLGNRQRVPQRHHGGGGGVVGNEDGGEILIVGAGPVKGSRKRTASTDLLDGEPLDVLVVLVINQGSGVERRRGLVAKTRWPGRKGRDVAALVHDTGF